MGSNANGLQQFCLRWNNYQTNLTSVFEQLLQSEEFVDVTLACDGRSLKAHKVVLSACSPYFQSLLSDNPCQHPIIFMRDVAYNDLKPLVDFMYRGEINVGQDHIPALLQIAEALQIRGLAEVRTDSDTEGATPKKTLDKNGGINAFPNIPGLECNASSSPQQTQPKKKKRKLSGEDNNSPIDSPNVERLETNVELQNDTLSRQSSSPLSLAGYPTPEVQMHPAPPPTPEGERVKPPLPEVDIKPSIAEMIREEERVSFI